jgi:hypothetical protein
MMTDTAKKNFSTVLMVVVTLCWSCLFYLHYQAVHKKNSDAVLTPTEKIKIFDDNITPTKSK